MKNLTINCAGIESMAALHNLLTRELNFPQWYGANLDALHDQLTGLTEPTQLTFLQADTLPFPTAGLLRVLQDCQEENPLLTVVF